MALARKYTLRRNCPRNQKITVMIHPRLGCNRTNYWRLRKSLSSNLSFSRFENPESNSWGVGGFIDATAGNIGAFVAVIGKISTANPDGVNNQIPTANVVIKTKIYALFDGGNGVALFEVVIVVVAFNDEINREVIRQWIIERDVGGSDGAFVVNLR